MVGHAQRSSGTALQQARSFALLLGIASVLMPAALGTPRREQRLGRPSTTLEVTDETGRLVVIPQPVRRIVSLAPNLTETVFALGAGDRIVGDTDYCDYPAEALKKAHVGGLLNPSLEEIAALHPDLVLATRTINRLATVRAIERLGIAVYATDPHTVEQVLSSTERLGRLLGASEQADPVVTDLRHRLDEVRERLAGSEPRTVFFVTWVDPLISAGRNTFLADALRWAGARSVIDAPQDWPNISLEEVVRAQPEYLIFSSDDRKQIERQIAELRARPGWQDLEALRYNRVIVLGEALSRPSPRLLSSIEQLARALHPDRFTSDRPAVLRSPASPSQIYSWDAGSL